MYEYNFNYFTVFLCLIECIFKMQLKIFFMLLFSHVLYNIKIDFPELNKLPSCLLFNSLAALSIKLIHNITLSHPSAIAAVNSVTGNDCQFDICEFDISDQDDTENAVGHAHARSMHSKYANADANAKTYPQSGCYLERM